MAKIIVWANHKGGVGKTTGTANNAAALAERGERVLAVDLDPQGHLADVFGLGESAPRLEQVICREASARQAIVAVRDDLHVLPCSEPLAQVQFQVAADSDGDLRLHEALSPVASDYDYILLDSPPGIGFWSGMALMTAQWAIIPTLAEDLAVLSCGKIADFIERTVAQSNPSLRLLGVVVTQAKPKRWRLSKDTDTQLFADGLRELVQVPRQESAARALRQQQPFFWLQPDGMVASAHRQLAEIIHRETATVPA